MKTEKAEGTGSRNKEAGGFCGSCCDNRAFLAQIRRLAGEGKPFGILLAGIDDFKRINDLHTYSFGDRVLQEFAERMRRVLPEKCYFYRLEGDKFGVLYPDAGNRALETCYLEFRKNAGYIPEDGTEPVTFSVSAGTSRFPEDGTEEEILYRNARIALRDSKSKGKDRITLFSKEVLEKEQFEMSLTERLKEGVEHGYSGFELRFQPIVFAGTGELYGCEALISFSHPDFPEGVGPEEFVPLLEKERLMERTGGWILETALAWCALWRKRMPHFHMNINVTYRQFLEPDFRFRAVELINRHELPPSCITLELTESSRIADTEELSHIFDFLRSQGIRIAFDDFGTGYASLEIFRLLRADFLKIDKSFLERITYDVTDQKIVGQLISLCHSMDMAVCVEGIENPETERVLRQMKAELFQGFYYNKPLKASEFEAVYFEGGAPADRQAEAEEIFPGPDVKSMTYSDVRPIQAQAMEEIFNAANAGIFQVKMDEEFTFMTCNDGYRRMLGFTAGEIAERFENRALRLVYSGDQEYVNREIRRQLGFGDQVKLEFRLNRSDGSVFWAAGTGNVVKEPHGGRSLVVVILNQDEEKRARLADRARTECYETLLAGAPTGLKLLRLDRQLTVEYISPAYLELLGYQENDVRELFGGGYLNLIFGEDREGVLRELEERIREDSPSGLITLRYRVLRKDGSPVWLETVSRVLEAQPDGVRLLCSNVSDVPDTVSEMDKSRSAHLAMRYQEAVRQWGDVLLEYHFREQTVVFTENFRLLFGREPAGTLQEWKEHLHPDDVPVLLDALKQTEENHRIDPIEIRICSGNTKEYIWCSLILTPPEQRDGEAVSTLGRLNNIDTKKRERERLLSRIRLDPVTGLLNKAATEERIGQILAARDPDSCYGLFVIDLDNFRHWNDELGHVAGDRILETISNRLKNLFRRTDVIGRVGGDEFMALMECKGDQTLLKEKGLLLVRELGREITVEGRTIRQGVSVGAAHCPSGGKEFYDLYRRAESALYRAKEQGKGRCCLASE